MVCFKRWCCIVTSRRCWIYINRRFYMKCYYCSSGYCISTQLLWWTYFYQDQRSYFTFSITSNLIFLLAFDSYDTVVITTKVKNIASPFKFCWFILYIILEYLMLILLLIFDLCIWCCLFINLCLIYLVNSLIVSCLVCFC